MSIIATRPAPAPTGQLGRLYDRLRDYLVRRVSERTDRRAFRRMLTLDDTLLRDIGVHRGDVEWAARLPLSRSASDELQRIARESRLPQ